MKEHSLTGMKGDDGKYFPESLDARLWAREFIAHDEKFGFAKDEETMLGWFATAIMFGYDEGFRRGKKSAGIWRKITNLFEKN